MNASIAGNGQPDSPGWKPILINVALFQIAWFACVLGGAAARPSIGLAVVTAAVAYHLYMARRPLPETALLSIAALIGAFWDGQLTGHGWLVYPSGIVAEWIAPTWIIAMWVSFATTLNLSLRWLHGRYGLAMILGALGGPLAFYAGERLGGVQFSDPVVALSALSAGWALITPTLVLAAAHLDGYAPTRLLHTHLVAHVSVRKKISHGGTEIRREDAGKTEHSGRGEAGFSPGRSNVQRKAEHA